MLAGMSLSARRAWIEIHQRVVWIMYQHVALRKESVDRNDASAAAADAPVKSLSARRAWIEIQWRTGKSLFRSVALRKESVDRNATGLSTKSMSKSRSPQGERG